METLFKILKNSHVLTPEISKPQFLRLFYGDRRNVMPKYFDFYGLRDRVRDLKLKFYQKDQDIFKSSESSQQLTSS